MTQIIVPQSDPQSACSVVNNPAAYAASLQLKIGAGVLYTLRGYNSLASVQYIMLFDALALPADGQPGTFVPLAVASSAPYLLDFGPYGIPFSRGLWVCNSTTVPLKTIGAANCLFEALLK